MNNYRLFITFEESKEDEPNYTGGTSYVEASYVVMAEDSVAAWEKLKQKTLEAGRTNIQLKTIWVLDEISCVSFEYKG